MKYILNTCAILTIILYGLTFISCKKEYVPTLTTSETTNITGTSATSGGNITDEGTSTIISRGVCWSTGNSPTINDSKTSDGAGAGTFTSNLADLNGATTYYVRAYATNNEGTGYGMTMSFTTLGQIPSAISSTITNLIATGATLNGSVNANYLTTVVTFEYGTTTSYGATSTATQSPLTGGTITNVSANITDLARGTIYHYRVKAVNSLGTTYGSDMTFTTVYSIGESLFGGIIFYVDGTGIHGLVCAPSDQSNNIEWGCFGTAIAGSDGTALGTGNQNTIDIVNGCSTASIAANRCYDLVLGTYSDWFLPSKDELGLMFTNLKSRGLGGFNTQVYWSSSEVDANHAWIIYFINGMYGTSGKSYTQAVRAIRAY